jgi:hypothetical protein
MSKIKITPFDIIKITHDQAKELCYAMKTHPAYRPDESDFYLWSSWHNSSGIKTEVITVNKGEEYNNMNTLECWDALKHAYLEILPYDEKNVTKHYKLSALLFNNNDLTIEEYYEQYSEEDIDIEFDALPADAKDYLNFEILYKEREIQEYKNKILLNGLSLSNILPLIVKTSESLGVAKHFKEKILWVRSIEGKDNIRRKPVDARESKRVDV